MVYCGKPSKGCSNCRERKIRCDQKEPGCGQCEKRQQKCPGYRNLVDLMFRDESSHVIKKAKARARKKANLGISRPATPSDSEGRLSVTPEPRARPLSLVVPPTLMASSPAGRDDRCPDESMLMSPESGSWPVTPPMAQLYNLAPACQERGVAYFFSRFVSADETAPHLRFDFVRDVWKPSSSVPERQVDGVLASMTAVGLVCLAGTAGSPDLMDAARKSYGTALRLINHALRDQAEAVKDSTMLSVLILGMFEIMTENTPPALRAEAFSEHVSGAEALARMRGPDQFQTRAGRRMFSMLCQRAVMSCGLHGVPMPDSLIALWYQMPEAADASTPDRLFMPIMWRVLQLRYEMKGGLLTDPRAVVDTLLSIDREFDALAANAPPSWRYRCFQVQQHHPAVFGGICHLYSSLHHADVWSRILATRVLVLETILAEISRDLAGFAPTLDVTLHLDEYHKARRKLRHAVRDIAASVPQQLGLVDPADGSLSSGGAGHDDSSSAARIATVEIRETPSPPTSPSARSSSSSSSSSSPISSSISSSDAGGVGGSAVPSPLPASSTSPEETTDFFSPMTTHLFSPDINNPSTTTTTTTTHNNTDGNETRPRRRGPTILDATRARDPADEAERYMLLVSARSTLVWPLFVAGSASTSSSLAGALGGAAAGSASGACWGAHAYAVGRLRTLYMETGIRQADALANLLEEDYRDEREEEEVGRSGLGLGLCDGRRRRRDGEAGRGVGYDEGLLGSGIEGGGGGGDGGGGGGGGDHRGSDLGAGWLLDLVQGDNHALSERQQVEENEDEVAVVVAVEEEGGVMPAVMAGEEFGLGLVSLPGVLKQPGFDLVWV